MVLNQNMKNISIADCSQVFLTPLTGRVGGGEGGRRGGGQDTGGIGCLTSEIVEFKNLKVLMITFRKWW